MVDPSRTVAACAVAIAFTSAAGAPTGHAKNGEPFVWDRGRELGMTNRISHIGG